MGQVRSSLCGETQLTVDDLFVDTIVCTNNTWIVHIYDRIFRFVGQEDSPQFGEVISCSHWGFLVSSNKSDLYGQHNDVTPSVAEFSNRDSTIFDSLGEIDVESACEIGQAQIYGWLILICCLIAQL